ncbi:PREDICTED: uncharacterized protein LOC105364628, partial [Ceratosolen solmsi marchali]|uniref:Uncharacterized protein LOC105364628 n=1 Tax=Ceratosolen solmsi marchali TaxID=326594 RepID=A0AAJ7DYB8_9HYME
MSQVAVALGLVLGLQVWLSLCAGLVPPESSFSEERQVYAVPRSLAGDSRERRSSGLGSSFIRFGRDRDAALGSVSQPHTRSDTVIRFGRDGLNGRLNRLRQERMRRLARLALICAAKSQEDSPASSTE